MYIFFYFSSVMDQCRQHRDLVDQTGDHSDGEEDSDLGSDVETSLLLGERPCLQGMNHTRPLVSTPEKNNRSSTPDRDVLEAICRRLTPERPHMTPDRVVMELIGYATPEKPSRKTSERNTPIRSCRPSEDVLRHSTPERDNSSPETEATERGLISPYKRLRVGHSGNNSQCGEGDAHSLIRSCDENEVSQENLGNSKLFNFSQASQDLSQVPQDLSQVTQDSSFSSAKLYGNNTDNFNSLSSFEHNNVFDSIDCPSESSSSLHHPFQAPSDHWSLSLTSPGKVIAPQNTPNVGKQPSHSKRSPLNDSDSRTSEVLDLKVCTHGISSELNTDHSLTKARYKTSLDHPASLRSPSFQSDIPFMDEICSGDGEMTNISPDQRIFPSPPKLDKNTRSLFSRRTHAAAAAAPVKKDFDSLLLESYHPDFQTLETRQISLINPDQTSPSKHQPQRTETYEIFDQESNSDVFLNASSIHPTDTYVPMTKSMSSTSTHKPSLTSVMSSSQLVELCTSLSSSAASLGSVSRSVGTNCSQELQSMLSIESTDSSPRQRLQVCTFVTLF